VLRGAAAGRAACKRRGRRAPGRTHCCSNLHTRATRRAAPSTAPRAGGGGGAGARRAPRSRLALAKRGERRQHVAQAAVVAAAAVRLARLPVGVRRLAVERAERQAEHRIRPSRRRRHACARRGCPGHRGGLRCAQPASRGADMGASCLRPAVGPQHKQDPRQVLRLSRHGGAGQSSFEPLAIRRAPQHAGTARGAAGKKKGRPGISRVRPRPQSGACSAGARGTRRPAAKRAAGAAGPHRRAARRRAATESSARRGPRPPAGPAPQTAAPAALAACAGGPRTRSAAPPAPARPAPRERVRAAC